MKLYTFVVALVAALTLALAGTPVYGQQEDLVFRESLPMFPAEGGLQSHSAGATVGPGGVYYLPLRVHYTTDVSSANAHAFYALLQAFLDEPFEVSGINARFILEGPFPWNEASAATMTANYNMYAEDYPFDGRFGMLLVPHDDGNVAGAASVPDPGNGMVIRSVVSLEGWTFAGGPLDASFVNLPTHELGHNLGALHSGCPVGNNMNGCGFVNSKNTASIMEVRGDRREARFSDRTAVVEGEPFGDANSSAVQFINARLQEYANHTAPVVVPCTVPDPLELHGGRFKVHVCYDVSDTVTGFGKPQTDTVTPRAANFWFFNPDNTELVLKIQNACVEPFNHYWFFAAGLTNVGVTITVVDTDAGLQKTYRNPRGSAFAPIQDNEAFDTCP